jgi:hypothetical protein
MVDGSGEGTHLASSLKDLQALGVDTVAVTGGAGGWVDINLGDDDYDHDDYYHDAFDGGLATGLFADGYIANLNIDSEQLVEELAGLSSEEVTENVLIPLALALRMMKALMKPSAILHKRLRQL